MPFRSNDEIREAISGALLLAFRESKLTYSSIASALSMQERQVQRYVRGEVLPPMPFIERFAEVINVPTLTILQRAGIAKSSSSVEGAIESDPDLTSTWKEALLAMVRTARQSSRELR